MTVDELAAPEVADDAAGEPAELAEEAGSRQRFNRAALTGGGLGALVFLWMLTTGTFDPFRWQKLGDFYDAQAHSLLDGTLAIDPEILGIEAFLGRGGDSYMYQGPVPALLRLPIVAVGGHGVDGRLTVLSMLAAAGVLLLFATRLHWTARGLLRGPAPMGRGEAAIVGLFSFMLIGGSGFTYLASRAWVYHEALAWGAALALASIDRLVELVRRPRAATLAWCSVLVAATLLTRTSIGLGPLAGLGLVAAGAVLGAVATRRRRRWPLVAWLVPGTQDASRRPGPALFVVALLAPLAVYAAVNQAKFGQWFSIPFWGQRFTVVDRGRQAMLASNDGTLFGLKYAPTTLLHYLRPDGLRFVGTFPFVEFPGFPGRVFGNAIFDLQDRTASVPVAQAFFALPAVVAVGHAFRPSRWSERSRSALRIPLLAAGASAAAIFPFAYIANRYVGDFVPLLALGGAVGLQVLLAAPRRPRRQQRAVGVALVVLAVWTAWVNLGLGLVFQRLWSPLVPPEVIAGFLGFQDDVDRALGGDGLDGVIQIGADEPLPDGVGRPGALVIAGDCEGLFLSDGMFVNDIKVSPWNGVERSVEGGHRRFVITIPRAEPGTIVPILVGGTEAAPYGILLEHRGGDLVRFLYRGQASIDRTDVDFPVTFDEPYDLDVVTDWRSQRLSVRLGDAIRMETWVLDRGPWTVGRNDLFGDVEPRYPGELEARPVETPLCDRLLERLDAGG